MACKHDGERFRCDKCDYKSVTNQSLKHHTQFKHDGLRYVCEECDFEAAQKQYLKSHIAANHAITVITL